MTGYFIGRPNDDVFPSPPQAAVRAVRSPLPKHVPALLDGLDAVVRPRLDDVLRYHQQMAPRWDHPQPQLSEAERFERYSNFAVRLALSVTSGAVSGETFYASPEASALVQEASAQPADLVPATVADLPSPSGFAYFGAAVPEESFYLLWHTDSDPTSSNSVGIQMATAAGLEAFLLQNGEAGWGTDRALHMPLQSMTMDIGEPADDAPPGLSAGWGFLTQPPHVPQAPEGFRNIFCWDDPALFIRVLMAFTDLLRMERSNLTTSDETVLSKRTHSRGRRVETVVRHLSYRGSATPAETIGQEGRLKNRHIVRGHWHTYRYGPDRHERRRRWVEAHIKGPDGAPLIVRRRVNIVPPPPSTGSAI